jgi:hypothetical protein
MRSARALIHTLREAPADAGRVSDVRLLRAARGDADANSGAMGGSSSGERRQDTKNSRIVALDRAATEIFEQVQRALHASSAGEAA